MQINIHICITIFSPFPTNQRNAYAYKPPINILSQPASWSIESIHHNVFLCVCMCVRMFAPTPHSVLHLHTLKFAIWAKTENPLLPGVTKLISMLFFRGIKWAKL